MWQQEFTWFFSLFQREFRQSNPIAFEVLMVLALAHVFGLYNPGIRIIRDSEVSVRYSERVNSSKSSVSLQRTDRYGIVGQERCHLQLDL